MKRFIAIALVGLTVIGAAFADETAQVYQRLYAKAKTLDQKIAAMNSLLELNDQATAPTLADALKELIKVDRSSLSVQNKESYDRLVRIIAAGLGSFRYVDAQDDLMLIAQSKSSAVVRSEALFSLGKMRSVKYAETIALMLRDLNFKPTDNVDEGEILAYGCIQSLESLHDPVGWTPVFVASQAWYSQRVKKAAEDALPNIMEDPTEIVNQVIQKDALAYKIAALKYENASRVPNSKKISAAITAFSVGNLNSSDKNIDKAALKALRVNAMKALISLKDTGVESTAQCITAWEVADVDEKLVILATLGANGSDDAAMALSDIINDYNNQKDSGLVYEDLDRLAKAAIQNAGITKNKKVEMSLLSVQSNTKWSGSVLQAAADALKNIRG
jgi:hypothetical protein